MDLIFFAQLSSFSKTLTLASVFTSFVVFVRLAPWLLAEFKLGLIVEGREPIHKNKREYFWNVLKL